MGKHSFSSWDATRPALSDIVYMLNENIRPLDRMLFAANPTTMPGPLFIVGAPRSGTTLTFQVLAQVLQVSWLPRLLDYGYGVSNLTFRFLRKHLRRPAPVFRSSFGSTPGMLSPSEAHGFWRRWFPDDADGAHFHQTSLSEIGAADLRSGIYDLQGHLGRPLLVKCLYLCFAITAIADAISNARFLLVTRDPAATTASLLRARRRVASRKWWSVRPPGYRNWMNEPLKDQVGWQISETLRWCRNELNELPSERWRVISFEQLCRDPEASALAVADWLIPFGYANWADLNLPADFVLPSKPSEAELAEVTSTRWYRMLREDQS